MSREPFKLTETAPPPAGGRATRPFRPAIFATLACVVLSLLCAPAAGAAGWLAPDDISVATQSASAPRVAVQPGGAALAVWTRSNGTNTIAQVARREADGAWQAPVDLSAAGRDAADAQIVVDPQGNAVAAWQRSNGTNIIIQAAVRPAGGAWQSPVDLSAAGWNAFNPRLAIDAQGTAIAVWQRFNGANVVIQSSVRAPGGSWQAPANLSVTGRDATLPAVAVNAQGTAVAVWQRSNGSNLIIQAAMRPAGGAWQAPADLSTTGADAATPQVAIDPNGNAVAVWDRQAYAQSAIRAAGGGWQGAVDLSIGCRLPTNPQVATSPQGVVAAIWTCLLGSSPAVQASQRPPGAGWEAAVTLAPGGSAITPQIAFDPMGNTLAVWGLAVRSVVQGSTRPAAGAWRPAVDLSPAGANSTAPQLAVDGQGNAVGVWRRYNGSLFVAQGARYDGVAPVFQAVVVPPLGVVGQSLTFSASAVDAWSPLGPLTWSFGDGTTATGSTVTHTYAGGGTVAVEVTATDAVGNATSAARLVTIAGVAGGGGLLGDGATGTGTPSGSDGPAGSGGPVATIARLDLSRSTFRATRLGAAVLAKTSSAGTRVSYALNRAANVRFAVQSAGRGRLVGGRCVKATSRNRSRKACTRYTTLRGAFTRQRRAGPDKFTFSGRLRNRALAPSRYRLVATPIAGSRAGRPKVAKFRIVR